MMRYAPFSASAMRAYAAFYLHAREKTRYADFLAYAAVTCYAFDMRLRYATLLFADAA